MTAQVAQDLRAREVAESSCNNAECAMCAEYIATGNKVLRPASREEYKAGLVKSYPAATGQAVPS